MENKDTQDKKEGDGRSVTGSNFVASSERADGQESQMGADIQKILKGVKLPEREEHRTSGDKKLTFDTKAVSALSEEIDTAVLLKSEDTKVPNVPLPVSEIEQKTYAPDSVEEKIESTVPSTSQESVALEKLSGKPEKDTVQNKSVTALRTLKEDLQGIIRTKKMSLVRAVALEEEKKRKRDVVIGEIPKESHRTLGTVLLAFVFLILGALALYGVFVALPGSDKGAAVVEPALMFRERVVPFLFDSKPSGEVKRELFNVRSSIQMTLGAVVQVVPIRALFGEDMKLQERPATLAEFFDALDIVVPDSLLRALSSEFFFGVHIVDENASLLVVPVNSYERAFTGMLAWEKNMSSDLSPIFTPVTPLTVDESGLLVWRNFEDLIIRNYDVRALSDDNGAIQLYYSFPTRDILIIAESTYSFTEILSRLRAEQRL